MRARLSRCGGIWREQVLDRTAKVLGESERQAAESIHEDTDLPTIVREFDLSEAEFYEIGEAEWNARYGYEPMVRAFYCKELAGFTIQELHEYLAHAERAGTLGFVPDRFAPDKTVPGRTTFGHAWRERVEALGYVLLMALLLYSLIERRAREALKDADEPMDLAGGPMSFRPTGRRVLERFENVLVMQTDGKRELPDNDNLSKRVLELLDLSVAAYGIEPEV